MNKSAFRRNMMALRALTVASIKMYVRNFSGMFFTLFIPVVLVVIFGFLTQGNQATINLGLDNQSHTQLSQQLEKEIRDVSAFKIQTGDKATLDKLLGTGKIDLEVVIPPQFGQLSGGTSGTQYVQAYYNKGRPQQGQAASLILGQLISGFNDKIANTPKIVALNSQGVTTNNLGTIDFILPGIMAMSIMQLGLFSVSFAFIAFKTTGALRRLQATPTHPLQFLVGQSITRLLIGLAQVFLLLGLGLAFFNMHLLGSVFSLLVIAILGILVFLAMGFSVAGAARDENQAAPLSNLISFPQLFLGGVFFPRDDFPAWLHTVTNYLPITYLSDGMRRVANEGASLFAIRGDILGLVIWGVIAFGFAVWLFRWE